MKKHSPSRYTVPNRISIGLNMYEYSNTRTVVSYVVKYYLLMLASGETRRDYSESHARCLESDQSSSNKVRDQPHVKYGFWQDAIYLKPKVEE
jgi:hypothetical protein